MPDVLGLQDFVGEQAEGRLALALTSGEQLEVRELLCVGNTFLESAWQFAYCVVLYPMKTAFSCFEQLVITAAVCYLILGIDWIIAKSKQFFTILEVVIATYTILLYRE